MPSIPDEILAGGHYARKQIFSRSRLVAWSHGRRFAIGLQLVASAPGGRLLDYGCGDGTFLALARESFRSCVGSDADPGQVADCSARFQHVEGVSFVTTDALRGREFDGAFDAIVCMEVLEHCPADVQEAVLDDLRRLARPGGLVVISVPIEIGPALAAKQGARALAASRGLREYSTRERYSPRELLRMVCATGRTAVPREEVALEVAPGRVLRYTGHKGFNWRALEPLVRRRFDVGRRLFSPMPWMGPWLNSQVWFECRRT